MALRHAKRSWKAAKALFNHLTTVELLSNCISILLAPREALKTEDNQESGA